MPRGYKPAMISDWRIYRRRPFTLADAMLTRPDLKLSTVLKIAGWAARNRYRRWRLGATATRPQG
jgi:hypothetical protein